MWSETVRTGSASRKTTRGGFGPHRIRPNRSPSPSVEPARIAPPAIAQRYQFRRCEFSRRWKEHGRRVYRLGFWSPVMSREPVAFGESAHRVVVIHFDVTGCDCFADGRLVARTQDFPPLLRVNRNPESGPPFRRRCRGRQQLGQQDSHGASFVGRVPWGMSIEIIRHPLFPTACHATPHARWLANCRGMPRPRPRRRCHCCKDPILEGVVNDVGDDGLQVVRIKGFQLENRIAVLIDEPVIYWLMWPGRHHGWHRWYSCTKRGRQRPL